ncbi:hypothetical protein PTRG_02819 [Pyrenophora tritici-repentis Pt-1C-BFP]|uniref:Uncharacterized protein n=1 Tax=Pyrenophora tritici-repentis (strain Pt-1C-BFP) TaxID=426418 RepID=B2VZH9_PYRTR|nr:uncharacterized protein PTRG_02819 [Pyrenophora tritici-repentis Pt-1C-BFP]EDU45342.1 hypothetical protein PTRG_02819 [Pyrenophora tritici-repentis Pt-1C-BFP]
MPVSCRTPTILQASNAASLTNTVPRIPKKLRGSSSDRKRTSTTARPWFSAQRPDMCLGFHHVGLQHRIDMPTDGTTASYHSKKMCRLMLHEVEHWNKRVFNWTTQLAWPQYLRGGQGC